MPDTAADEHSAADERSAAREKLGALIRKYRFAMLTTREGDGALRSRPMTTIERDFDGALWFFAPTASSTVDALKEHEDVCLSYADSENFDFVCVAGRAEIVADPAMKRELWKPQVQAWFPQGPDAPSTVLIKVMPAHAEYWDSNSSKLVQLFSMAKALATGTEPRGIGEHRKVDLAGRDAGNGARQQP